MSKNARALIEERDYAVVALVAERDERGEEIAKSDRLLIAYQIQQRCEHETSVIEETGQYAVVAELGDAPEAEFEEMAGRLSEASSW